MNAPTTKKSFSSYQVLVIFLIAITQFTVVLDFMVMSPLGDMLMKSMHLHTSKFGLVVSGYAYSAGIAGILTAGFADRFDRKKLLLFFYIGFIAGTLFCGMANSFALLMTARIVTGLFGGVIGSIAMAIITDLFVPEQRGRVMGFAQMGLAASQVLGIPISLYLANHWGWQSPFLMIVGLSLVVWLIIALKLKPVTHHLQVKSEKNVLLHLWHTLLKRDYRIAFLATALLSLGGFMMMPWGSAFAINNLHVSQHQLPILFMISGVGTMIIMPLMGTLSDRMDRFRLFTIASVWMSVVVLIYTNLQPVPLALIITLNILMTLGIMGRMIPSTALVSVLPDLPDRGAFMSINASLQQLAGGIAATVSGYIVTKRTDTSPLEHYNTLGYVVVAVGMLCIWMLYRVNRLVLPKKQAAIPKMETIAEH